MTSLPSLLTANEVAEEFRLDPETIRRWARDGQIKSIRLPSGLYRFRREDIEALIAGREPVESGERAA
jgi:excisionase family DNA binding protein